MPDEDFGFELRFVSDGEYHLMAVADLALGDEEVELMGFYGAEADGLPDPVVVADGGPLPELLKDDVGEKVQPLDSDELAEVIEKIFSNPPRFKSMSEKARAVVSEHFSAEQMAGRHEDLYREISTQPS